jgi:thiamine-phosphate pyrophosphorylase
MKLILMTLPHFFIEEHQILTALFDEGLETLHLRKPDTEPVYSERLLSLLPEEYRKNIVVHDHFYLKNEYGLKGIHLNQRNPEIPRDYKGHVSRSCHSIEEVTQYKKQMDYLFLSPIFDSISKEGYHAPYSPTELRNFSQRGLIDKKVMALGGIDIDQLSRVKDLGFGGAVINGALWRHFDMHRTSDFKELINYFRKLRKALG